MLILIRKLRAGDEERVQPLLRDAVFSSFWVYFIQMSTREITAQGMLLLAAAIFVGFGWPLHYCLYSIPITAFVVFLIVFLAHWRKYRIQVNELYGKSSKFEKNPKLAFYVAEEVTKLGNSTLERRIGCKKGVEFLVETANSKLNSRNIPNKNGEIIGTITIETKHDPDMKEPPESVGWLRRLAVKKGYRRKGIGDGLIDAAIKHCLINNFRAIEASVGQCHETARNLLVRKGFDILQSYRKEVFLMMGIKAYRLRMPCLLKRSMLDS